MTQRIVGQGDKLTLDLDRQFSCASCLCPFTVRAAIANGARCGRCRTVICALCGCSRSAACMSDERGPCAWTAPDRCEVIVRSLQGDCNFTAQDALPKICSECYFQAAEQLYYETGTVFQDEFGDIDREIEPNKIRPFSEPKRPSLIF